MTRDLLPVIFSALLAFGAHASPPDLGDMVFLPGDHVAQPAAGSQTAPSIARGGDIYLSAWQDDRGNSPDLFAARIGADGTPIDVMPIPIAQAAGSQMNPQVAWNGSNWLVAWDSQIPTQYYYARGVLGVRVSPEGDVLDPQPITIIAYQNSSSLLYSLASDGTNWAVVAEGTSAGEAAIRGVRVSPSGTVLDPGGVVVVPETYFLRFGIALGGLPGEYLLVWNEWRSGASDDVLAYRLDPALQKLDATPIVVGSHPQYDANAKVASNGSGFFVAWNVNDNYLSSDVYGARVSYGGQVLDPNGKAFSNAGVGYGRNPSVAWDGINWIASWPNYGSGGLNAGRMSPQGSLLDPGGVSMPSLGWGTIAGAAAGGLVAAWSDATGGSEDVYAAPISASLQPGGRTCSSLAAPRQTVPSLAWTGEGYLAVFLSATSAGSRVLGQRLDAFGQAIDGEPFEIAGPAGSFSDPSVAWDGDRFLVGWVQQSRIYARRVDRNGALIDPAPILVMNGGGCDVAGMAGVFLVTGYNAPTNPEYVSIFAVRIRGSDGVKLDASPITVGGSYSLYPRATPVGNRWLVVWEQHPTHDDPHASVLGNFVETNGAVGTPVGMGGIGAYNLRPDVAAHGDTALVVWSDSRLGFNNLDVYGRRVLAGGAVLDGSGIAISTAANSQTRPAVGWDGVEFVASFQDLRNIPVFFDERLDVYGGRITGGGQALDPGGFAVANDPLVSEIHPVVSGGDGTGILGCAAFLTGAPYAAFRVGFRPLLNSDPAGASDLPAAERVHLMVATPNPSSAAFDLRIAPMGAERIRVRIVDLLGREVVRLHEGEGGSTPLDLRWDGRGPSGGRLPAGVYLLSLERRSGIEAVKLILR